ncbi:hypothetical protein CBS101457_001887 [Exobasidium rhododendri]|nr:hypothetical protein CBS101457_001887 [Exobasidium rhododendri]
MTSIQRPEYIVEHMEDLDADPNSPTTFPYWALLEYSQMLKMVGPGSTVHFTGLISHASKQALHDALSSKASTSPRHQAEPVAHFEVHSEGILEMARKNNISIDQICLLDPKSPFPLSIIDASPSEQHSASTGGGPFRYFLLGGILGDDPPRDRTGHLRAMGFPSRHLGTVQMTTDGALGVTKTVVEDGKALNLPGTESKGPNGAIEWIDHPELRFGRGESVTMPFRYMTEITASGLKRPLMAKGMREHIKEDFDRSLEF